MPEFIRPETEDAVTQSKVDHMLRDILRVPEMFAVARGKLRHDLFDPSAEPQYRVLWQTVCRLADKYGESVLFDDPVKVRTFVETELQDYVHNHPDEVQPEFWPQLFDDNPKAPGLVPWIYSISQSIELDPVRSREYLKNFLRQREVQNSLRKALTDAGQRTITNLPNLLREYLDRDTSIQAVEINPIESVSPILFKPQPLNKFPCGIPFLDKAMAGGHAPGEVYGVLGAYAAGKTVMAVQLVCQTAMSQIDKKRQMADKGIEYKPKVSYLFHYESSAPEIRARIWSHIAEIEWTRLQDGDISTLSTKSAPASLQEYEKRRWKKQLADNPGAFLYERERLMTKMEMYEECIKVVDMSGNPSNPARGSGYVAEISQILQTWLPKDTEIGVVVIDYAGLVVERHMEAKSVGDERRRHLVGRMADTARRLIASPFRCPVWITHQLNAAANRRTHATLAHHADAAEAKNFAENLWFCFNMGIPDPKTRCIIMTCTKARRAALPPKILLKLDGALSKLIEAEHDKIDEATGEIVPISENMKWHDPSKMTGILSDDAIAAGDPTDILHDTYAQD